MASGDVYSTGVIQVATGAYLDFRPDVGYEITLHNIHASDSFELQYTDGINSIVIQESTSGQSISSVFYECNNTFWYRILNISVNSQNMSGTGRYSKTPDGSIITTYSSKYVIADDGFTYQLNIVDNGDGTFSSAYTRIS
jgi:hypothetical protein